MRKKVMADRLVLIGVFLMINLVVTLFPGLGFSKENGKVTVLPSEFYLRNP